VGERDPSEAISASAIDPGVPGELVAPPQDDADAPGLEEDRLLDLLPALPQLPVELPRPVEIGYAQGDELSLCHGASSRRRTDRRSLDATPPITVVVAPLLSLPTITQ
jgi:hypothetical protein